jgi:ArsR family transcriptional regulator, arsenate/arsenite/antimonite-responsive transcriptional repressor
LPVLNRFAGAVKSHPGKQDAVHKWKKMGKKLHPQYEARANIIKAIGHPARLFILEELNKKERCVNELTDMIGSDISTVSKHLSILKNSGLVIDEKRGTNIYYKLRTCCVLDFIGCIETVLKIKAENEMKIAQCCGINFEKNKRRT